MRSIEEILDGLPYEGEIGGEKCYSRIIVKIALATLSQDLCKHLREQFLEWLSSERMIHAKAGYFAKAQAIQDIIDNF